MQLIAEWIQASNIVEGFLFLYEGKPVRKEYLQRRFEIGLQNAGIKKGERKLVPYSLRYTFRSCTHGTIDAQLIKDMMGHRSEQMSQHYLRITPEQFEVFKPYQDRINQLWTK
jgi:integrase